MNLAAIVAAAIGAIGPLIPFVGPKVQEVTERAATLPEKTVRDQCKGMSEEDTQEAILLARKAGDAISDYVVFVASRGTIEPDE